MGEHPDPTPIHPIEHDIISISSIILGQYNHYPCWSKLIEDFIWAQLLWPITSGVHTHTDE